MTGRRIAMSERVAIVVGAGGELGRATAEKLAAAGFTVVGVGRSEEGLKELPDGIRREAADPTDPAAARSVVNRIAAEVGPPEVLVNTIGTYHLGDALTATPEDLRLMIDVNVGAALWLTQAVAPYLRERGSGSIVHVAARPGLEPTAGMAAYAVSKAALVPLTRVLHLELRPLGIRAHAVAPGGDHPELAVVRATVDLVQGRLDEAAAHLAVAETYAETAPPDRQRRLQVAIASLKLRLARRRADLVGVLEQVRFLDSPVTGQPDEDIALGSDLRAVALMHLGTVELWSLALGDGERCLRQRALLAREIGRPSLPVGCRAQLGFASTAGSFAAARRRCLEAIVLAQRHGWDAEPVIAPALVTLPRPILWMY